MATYRRWDVTDDIDNFLDSGETVWPYDYRRSYVPSRPVYGVYPRQVAYPTEMPGRRPGVYEYEEVVSTPEQPRTYDKMSDEEIRDRIFDRLDHDHRIPHDMDILVAVLNGVVTLTGSARNRRTKELVGQHAWQQPGVEDVHNNVNIAGRWRQTRPM